MLARIAVRLLRLQLGNPGDHRFLGDGVSELKIDHGPGYRIYYARRGDVLILLLGGGDKSTQASDIERAKARLKGWIDASWTLNSYPDPWISRNCSATPKLRSISSAR